MNPYLNSLFDFFSQYSANNDINSFIKNLQTYFTINLSYDLPLEYEPLIQYLQHKSLPKSSNQFCIWSVSQAFEKALTYNLQEYELFNDFNFRHNLPVLKIGEDLPSKTEFWLILKKVIYGVPNAYVTTVNKSFLYDRIFTFLLINKEVITASDLRDDLMEIFQVNAKLNILQLMQINRILNQNNPAANLKDFLLTIPSFNHQNIFTHNCLEFLRPYLV